MNSFSCFFLLPERERFPSKPIKLNSDAKKSFLMCTKPSQKYASVRDQKPPSQIFGEMENHLLDEKIFITMPYLT